MTDLRVWVRAHRVCWEIEPLRELVQGHGVQQTGYELRLYGRLDLHAEEDAHRAALRLHDGLREVALDLLHSLSQPSALIEVRPFDGAVHVPPGTDPAVEIELAVVAFPAHLGHPMREAEAQRHIAVVEEKLGGMGLKRRPLADLRDVASSHSRLRGVR